MSPKSLGTGKYLQLIKDGNWEYVHRIRGVGATAIVALTRDQDIVLVEQYRPALKQQVIDLPAGLVGDEDDTENDYEAAARRELLEETGYVARSMKFLVDGPTTSGLATEKIHFYLARNVTKKAEGGGVAGENIIVHVIPCRKVLSWFKRQIKAGKEVDVKAYFAVSWIVATLK